MSKLKILVAEDETIIRLDLVEMLTEAGYEVVAQAENGLKAIELANELKPDLNRTFMVGDKLVDIEFAANLGIKPINISSKVTSNIPSVEFAANWRDFQMNIIGKLIS